MLSESIVMLFSFYKSCRKRIIDYANNLEAMPKELALHTKETLQSHNDPENSKFLQETIEETRGSIKY